MAKFKNPWAKGGKYYPAWLEETKNEVLGTTELYGGNKNTYRTRNHYSINVYDRELNPDNYVLGNIYMQKNIIKLYKELVNILQTSNFEFKVTGGDRYIKDNIIYSATNHKEIPHSSKNSPHLIEKGARAVDLRIRKLDGSGNIIPLNIVRKAQKKTDLIFDEDALPFIYGDKHFHLQLPNIEKFGGAY